MRRHGGSSGGVRRRGQVLIVAMICIALLAGLVLFVYNLGDQLDRRQQLQDAADATAISGGGHMARSYNVIAMNNVGAAKCLALVPVMDALPRATKISLEEVTLWEQALGNQVRGSMPNDANRQVVYNALENLRKRMETQRDILRPMNDKFNGGYDIRRDTYWRPPGGGGAPPYGSLWRTAVALDEFSQATAEAAGVLAQANAVQWGQYNGAKTAFMAPIVPEIPVRSERSFNDFRYPIEGYEKVLDGSAEVKESGGAGGAIPDMVYPHRLGPYARLHRWRHYLEKATSWEYVQGTGNVGKIKGGSKAPSIGGRKVGGSAHGSSGGSSGGHAGRWRATSWERIGYTTFGPFHWAMDRLDWWANDHYGIDWGSGGYRTYHEGHLPDTRFYYFINQLARIKLGYMFTTNQPKMIHVPKWDYPNYPDARSFAQKYPSKVKQTMFYQIEIASRVPEGGAGYLSPGTYRANEDRALSVWSSGWVDPAGVSGLTKVSNYIWKGSYYYWTTLDADLGIALEYDDAGQPIWHKVYMIVYYVFGGIDVGENEEVYNPCNYEGGDQDLLPAPTLLRVDASTGGDYDPYNPDPDQGLRRKHFAFFGIAGKGKAAREWSQRFQHGNPADSFYAVAQAEVFNKESWDLWTQDWQVRLKPVRYWSDWASTLNAGRDRIPDLAGVVTDQEVEAAVEYMSRWDPVAVDYWLNH